MSTSSEWRARATLNLLVNRIPSVAGADAKYCDLALHGLIFLVQCEKRDAHGAGSPARRGRFERLHHSTDAQSHTGPHRLQPPQFVDAEAEYSGGSQNS